MRRREVIAGLGSAAGPLAARAQPAERVRRVGALMPYDDNDPPGEGSHLCARAYARCPVIRRLGRPNYVL